MPALNQKITFWRGDTGELTFPVKNKDGTWKDLTGAQSARWWMGKNVNAKSSSVYIEKNNDPFGGLEIVNPGGGDEWDLVITIKPIDTENLKAGDFYHEAEVVDAAGQVSTVMTGPFILVATMIPDRIEDLSP
jgi:hypothetical protein